MSERRRLPNRRPVEIIDTEFRRRRYAVLIGRFEDGTVAECFCEPAKVGNDGAEDSRDCGILVSLALQHGVPIETMQSAVSRIEQGRPASLTGHLVDLLAAENAAALGGGA